MKPYHVLDRVMRRYAEVQQAQTRGMCGPLDAAGGLRHSGFLILDHGFNRDGFLWGWGDEVE